VLKEPSSLLSISSTMVYLYVNILNTYYYAGWFVYYIIYIATV